MKVIITLACMSGTWSEELLMQAKNDDDDDPCGGQRLTEIKYSKQCSLATKLGQKNR